MGLSYYEIIKDIYNLIFKRWKNRLSKEEKEFLLEMLLNNNQLAILSMNQTEKWVRIGKNNYSKERNEEFRVKYLEMVEHLIDLDYIVHESGILYRLTLKGIETAKRCKS